MNCTTCRRGLFFTYYQFENTGLYKHYVDSERARITKQDVGKAKFKLNVQITAPYMHNGSMDSLNQVIDHYAAGNKNYPSKSQFVNGFSISNKEKSIGCVPKNTY